MQQEEQSVVANDDQQVLQSDINNENEQAILELSRAFEGAFIPTLDLLDSQLNEIHQSQTLLMELIHDQNRDWQSMPHIKEIERIFNKIPLYLQKTRDASKRMTATTYQLDQLKKRTEKLKNKGN